MSSAMVPNPPLRQLCFVLILILLACSSEEADFRPLYGTDQGLVELAWGDDAKTATEKLLRTSGVEFLSDTTVIVEDEPLYVGPDSVIPPRVGDLHYDQRRFTGGMFLGYTVDQWQLWFSGDGKLRIVEIIFPSALTTEDLYEDIGNKLLVVYGIPEKGGIVWKKYRSRNWSERTDDGEIPETGALLTWVKIPGHVTLTYHDLAYADSLDMLEYGEPISLKEWIAMERDR